MNDIMGLESYRFFYRSSLFIYFKVREKGLAIHINHNQQNMIAQFIF
jgi:hypothetical protein